MKQTPKFLNALRYAVLPAIIVLGLVSIIGTGGGSGGGETGYGVTYYRDADGDGYGDPGVYMKAASLPQGYVTYNTDCDDTDAVINPEAVEVCDDGIDNNCNGRIDEGCICTDADGDGYYAESDCGTAVDCNDADARIRPGAQEICWDGVDNNCDGQLNEGCTCTDADGDGYYAESHCGTAADCDDADADINPRAVEVCRDGIDNNCDGRIDENCATGAVPDTGQSICYNRDGAISCPSPGHSFYGQDASYRINPLSYTKLDSRGNELPRNAASWSMVRDDVTGLIWVAKTSRYSIHTWYYANDVFITGLNGKRFGGYSDWRLPTKKELIRLVNYGIDYNLYGLAITWSYFPGTMPAYYWSSTPYAGSSDMAWRVDFLTGGDYYGHKGQFCYTRAVRGEELSSSFTDNGDGTVTDQTTGLMWTQATADINNDGLITVDDDTTWNMALSWCENLSLAGYDDWRLPTIKELESIVDDEAEDPAVDAVYFPDTLSFAYWSSTTDAGNPDQAWLVKFGDGDNRPGAKSSDAYYVRAVRGGQ